MIGSTQFSKTAQGESQQTHLEHLYEFAIFWLIRMLQYKCISTQFVTLRLILVAVTMNDNQIFIVQENYTSFCGSLPRYH